MFLNYSQSELEKLALKNSMRTTKHKHESSSSSGSESMKDEDDDSFQDSDDDSAPRRKYVTV